MRRVTAFAAVLILLVTVSAAAAQDPFEVFVYVDRDTLTLHVPASGIISLEGIGFQVQVNNAARTADLADYPAFGLPFDQLPTPICFRLRSSGSRTPLPQACSGAITLTQDLAAADVFWYDAVAESSRVILVTQNGVPFTICPSGASECTGELTPPEPTSTPAPTVTAIATATPMQTPTLDEMVLMGWQTHTTADSVLSFYFPPNWVLEDRTLLTVDDVILASTADRLDSMLAGGARPMQRGDINVVITYGDGALYPEDASINTIEAMLDWVIATAESNGRIVNNPMIQSAGENFAASYRFEPNWYESVAVIVQLPSGEFVFLDGGALQGEGDACFDVMLQIASTIRIAS